MKRLALILALGLMAAKANAAGSQFNIAYSTFATLGVAVTSGTRVQINNTRPTGWSANIGFYRFTNSHPSWDIYVGDINVSTSIFNANVGHVLKANGGTVDWPVSRDPKRGSVDVPIYAAAADSSAVDRLPRLSVTWFGY